MQRVKSLQQQLDESEKQLIELHKISSKEDDKNENEINKETQISQLYQKLYESEEKNISLLLEIAELKKEKNEYYKKMSNKLH